MTLGCVFGGGGPFGIAWMLGVIDRLAEEGARFDGMPTIGTSAGTWVAGAVHEGVDVERFTQMNVPMRPSADPDALHDAAKALFGDLHVPTLSAVAVPFPGSRRVLLDGATVALADQVAASSALPGLVPPYRLGGVRYLDGGVRSSTSADLAGPADVLFVLAPLCGASLSFVGRLTARQLSGEITRWRAAHDGRAVVVAPDRNAARLAGLPHRLFDLRRMPDVYAAGREQAAALLDQDKLQPVLSVARTPRSAV